MKFKYIRKNQKGFTLVELLVVISIIGTLSSVVIANLNDSKVQAKNTVRNSHLREIGKASELYNADNGSYPLGSFDSRTTSGEQDWALLKTMLSPYINLPNAVYVPSASSWHYHYYYVGGTGVVFGAGPPINKCIKIINGYYLKTMVLNYPNSASLNDGGIEPNRYEVLGGDYEIHDGWQSCN